MFKITNNYIYHTRGDTASFNVGVCLDGQPIPYNTYTGTFSVKRALDDVGYVLQTSVVNGRIDLTPEMTKNLPIGEYWYDIELHVTEDSGDEIVETIGPYHYRLMADITR